MVTIALTLAGCKPEPLDSSLYPTDPVSLSLFDPPVAAMVHPGPVTVRGEVKGLTQLQVNGVAAKVDGNLWSADLELPRGITTFDVGGLDSTGHRVYLRQSVLAGDYGAFGAPIDQGIGIRLNQGGLNATGDLVAGLMDPVQIANLLPTINPVYQDSYGIFGFDAVEITADLQSLWFDTPDITLDPSAGQVEIRVALPNLSVVVPTYGQAIGIDFDEDLTLTSSNAVVDGFLKLGTKNGALTADLVDTTVDLQDFYFDTTLLPGPIEDFVLGDTIRSTIENVLTDQIGKMVPSLLNQQLSTLQIAFGTTLFDKDLNFGATFDHVSIDRDGVELSTDVDLAVSPSGGKDSEGWLMTGGSRPLPSVGPDLAVQVSDDVVNKLLHDLWRAGMLDLTLSTDDGSLDPLLLIPLGGTTGGSIATSAGLPPVLVQVGDQAMLELGEMTVTVDTPGGKNGDHLVCTLSGQVPLDLELAGQALTMKLGTPDILLMVRDNDWGGSNETITNVLTEQLPVATLLALLGDLAIPLPSIAGITIPDAKINRDDGGLSTTVDMNL